MIKRTFFFAYGVICHALFLVLFLYMAGFVGGFLVPKTIDNGAKEPLAKAVVIDILLMLAFAAQHSIMARPGFKKVWTKLIPAPIERSTYVLATCIVTVLMMWQWRPIDVVLWNFEAPLARRAMWSLFATGWLLVPGVTLLINHFDLFGTRQVWLHWKGLDYSTLPFREPLLYRHVRHPLYIGWTVAFWATPQMTAGHALFAGVMTLYMALAARVEERDLVAHFGPQYEDYRRRVPMFVPRLSGSTAEIAEPNS